MTPELIAANEFGRPIPLAQIYGAISYYLSHRQEMDAYVKRCDERIEKELDAHYAQEPSDVVKRLVHQKTRREAFVGS
jgi:predicted kinase